MIDKQGWRNWGRRKLGPPLFSGEPGRPHVYISNFAWIQSVFGPLLVFHVFLSRTCGAHFEKISSTTVGKLVVAKWSNDGWQSHGWRHNRCQTWLLPAPENFRWLRPWSHRYITWFNWLKKKKNFTCHLLYWNFIQIGYKAIVAICLFLCFQVIAEQSQTLKKRQV